MSNVSYVAYGLLEVCTVKDITAKYLENGKATLVLMLINAFNFEEPAFINKGHVLMRCFEYPCLLVSAH